MERNKVSRGSRISGKGFHINKGVGFALRI